MNPKILSLGVLFLCVGQIGCAASSNGGGLVVGNPLVSESSVQDSKTKPKPPACDCANSKDPKVQLTCKCATNTKTNSSTGTATKAIK